MTQQYQIPLGYDIIGPNGRMTQPWAFFFQTFSQNLPPSGSGYVTDGSAGTSGPMTLFWGPDSDKGMPKPGYIYFATDSGKIYIANGSSGWIMESPAYSGDVTKPANSTVLTLNNVNPWPGTWGSATQVPVITVNEKGLVTYVSTKPISTSPGGIDQSIQFNLKGQMFGSSNLTYDYTNDILTADTVHVNTEITFTTPSTTLNNLLPIQTNNAGMVLVTNGTNASWAPVGPLEFTFNYGDATPKPLFTVPAGKVVTQINIFITTPFNGVGSSLQIGDASNYGSLFASTDNNPLVESNWTSNPGVFFGSDTPIFLSIAQGTGCTQGAGLVLITIQE